MKKPVVTNLIIGAGVIEAKGNPVSISTQTELQPQTVTIKLDGQPISISYEEIANVVNTEDSIPQSLKQAAKDFIFEVLPNAFENIEAIKQKIPPELVDFVDPLIEIIKMLLKL